MNAIMYSSNPKQTAKVLNKEQTVIILKNIPAEWKEWLKDQSKPFPKKEMYLYCTKAKSHQDILCDCDLWGNGKDWYNDKRFYVSGYIATEELMEATSAIDGKVVARCVVEKIEELKWLNELQCYNAPSRYGSVENMPHCLSKEQINAYGKKKTLYALHLTQLEIFDKPRELGEFKHYKRKLIDCGMDCPPYWDDVLMPLSRPFQSWGYVEVDE